MIGMLVLALLSGTDDFEAVEREAVQLGADEGVARVEVWVAQHGGQPDEPRARLWQAQVRLTQGRFDDARRLLELGLAAHPADELAWDLTLTRADLTALEGQVELAVREYERLGAPAGSRWALQARLRAEALVGELARRGWARWLGVLAGLVVLARAAALRRRLWPPPEECTWGAPVLLAFTVAALAREGAERVALLSVALGGLGLLWVTGAALRGGRLSAPRRAAEVVLAVSLVGTLCFGAIVFSGLWPRVVETFAGGTE